MKLSDYFKVIFIKQNKHHRYGVLLHSLKLFLLTIKNPPMMTAALLHDIGKIPTATKDTNGNEYSFHDHAEKSYEIVKNWPISNYSKFLIRYHYLPREIEKEAKKNLNDAQKKWDELSPQMKHHILKFKTLDDLAKS